MKYNDNLDPERQLAMEEKIAAFLFDHFREGFNEGDAQEAGQEVLNAFIEEFRPDLIGVEPPGPKHQGLLAVPHDQLAKHAQEGWNLANDRTKELTEAKEVLGMALTQLTDLSNHYPTDELFESVDVTINRIKKFVPEEDNDSGDAE